MGAILGLLANPLILKAGLYLLDFFITKKQADKETKEALKRVAEFLRTQGVNAAKTSLEAEDQIALGEAEWERREKEKANQGEQ